MKVQRDGTFLIVDGHVKALAEKPIEGLQIVFEFRGAAGHVIGDKKVLVDEPVLEHGEEAIFHAESDFPTNAVDYKMRAYAQAGGKELSIANPGPHPIKFD